MVVGQDAEDEMVNGDVATTTSDVERVRRQDIIAVSGKQEDCEAVCSALRVSIIIIIIIIIILMCIFKCRAVKKETYRALYRS